MARNLRAIRDRENPVGARRGGAGRWGPLAVAVASSAALGLTGAQPASAAPSSYSTSATATGLEINLFGNEISGGNASATADSSAPKAHAEGTGTLLTSAGAQTDDVSDASGTGSGQSKPYACAQGGGTPSGTPVLVTVGLGCASSSASVSTDGWPASSALGQVGEIDVGLNGVLQPVLQGGASQLTQGLASGLGSCAGSAAGTPLAPLCAGLSQAVTNLQNTVEASGSAGQPDVVVKLGPATATVADAGGTGSGAFPVTATAEGESADIQVLPGVGSVAATFANGALSGTLSGAPLIEVKVAPATATSTFDGSKWTTTSHSSVATIVLNIPGDVQTIDLTAPGQCQEIAAGTPLDSTVCLSAASTSGGAGSPAAAQADSVRADLLTQLPGAPGHGIQLNLGDVTSTGTGTPATNPATTPAGTPAPAVPATLSASPPTAVHTGEWWSGSLPLLATGGGIGALLIGWPRVRRMRAVARMIARVHR
jgi:hypothetical protein